MQCITFVFVLGLLSICSLEYLGPVQKLKENTNCIFLCLPGVSRFLKLNIRSKFNQNKTSLLNVAVLEFYGNDFSNFINFLNEFVIFYSQIQELDREIFLDCISHTTKMLREIKIVIDTGVFKFQPKGISSVFGIDNQLVPPIVWRAPVISRRVVIIIAAKISEKSVKISRIRGIPRASILPICHVPRKLILRRKRNDISTPI